MTGNGEHITYINNDQLGGMFSCCFTHITIDYNAKHGNTKRKSADPVLTIQGLIQGRIQHYPSLAQPSDNLLILRK